MTSPVSLGAFAVALGGRAAAAWEYTPSAQFQMPGTTNIGSPLSITVANPNGANCLVMGGMSCYATAAGAVVHQYINIDGGGGTEVCQFYFNGSGNHLWCGTWAYLASLAKGAHSLQFQAWDANALCWMDGNDTAFMQAWELP